MAVSTPAWAQRVIGAHVSVAGRAVSHAKRLDGRRYFVWEEDDRDDWMADDRHAEFSVCGSTDLFTEVEFDPWVPALGAAFDEAGFSWRFTGTTFEPDTGLFHHSWEWTT